MSRKVFTAGEVLAAADVNSFLMDQTVMSFASSAARGSAIPTPTLGMYTHLEDTPARTQFWNGSAWISPFGSTLITNTSFTATTSFIASNVFSSAYEVYKIYLRFTTGGLSPVVQLRVGASTSATNYTSALIFDNGTSVTRTTRITTGFETFGGTTTDAHEITLVNPFEARTTAFSFVGNSVGVAGLAAGHHSLATSYDSLAFSFGNSSTGNVLIYGMRK